MTVSSKNQPTLTGLGMEFAKIPSCRSSISTVWKSDMQMNPSSLARIVGIGLMRFTAVILVALFTMGTGWSQDEKNKPAARNRGAPIRLDDSDPLSTKQKKRLKDDLKLLCKCLKDKPEFRKKCGRWKKLMQRAMRQGNFRVYPKKDAPKGGQPDFNDRLGYGLDTAAVTHGRWDIIKGPASNPLPDEVEKFRKPQQDGVGAVTFRRGQWDKDDNWVLGGKPAGTCDGFIDRMRLFRHETHHLVQPNRPNDPCDSFEAHVKIFCKDAEFICALGEWVKQPGSGLTCGAGFDAWLDAAKKQHLGSEEEGKKEEGLKEQAEKALADCRTKHPQ